ncbi:MAG: hypothetical protein M1553_14540 [Firmicutes bacterium]|nr:hypothetical protein [Bacillota bacterium]
MSSMNGVRTDIPTASIPRNHIWSISLRDAIWLTFCGAAIALSKFIERIPLHLPGHSGVVWMAILVLARGMVPWGGAASLVGIISGLLAALIGEAKEGPLSFFKFLAPGVTLDLFMLLIPGFVRHSWSIAVVAALAYVTKLMTSYVLGLAMGVPHTFLILGLRYAVVFHLVFGAVGGWLGWILVCRFSRNFRANNIGRADRVKD